jgi:hypothetical protein
MTTLKWRLLAVSGLVAILLGCASPLVSEAEEDFGGFIAFSVAGHPGVLDKDATYRFLLELSDGRSLEVDRSFASGTPVHRVVADLADQFRAHGFYVVTIPELGAARVGFVSGLKKTECSGAEGWTVSTTSCRRSSVANGP